MSALRYATTPGGFTITKMDMSPISHLILFACGRCPDGGRFLHAFLPEGLEKHEWRPEHLVDVPALLDECQIPYQWEEWSGMYAGGFWMPAWVDTAIKRYMTHHLGSGHTLVDFLRCEMAEHSGAAHA